MYIYTRYLELLTHTHTHTHTHRQHTHYIVIVNILKLPRPFTYNGRLTDGEAWTDGQMDRDRWLVGLRSQRTIACDEGERLHSVVVLLSSFIRLNTERLHPQREDAQFDILWWEDCTDPQWGAMLTWRCHDNRVGIPDTVRPMDAFSSHQRPPDMCVPCNMSAWPVLLPFWDCQSQENTGTNQESDENHSRAWRPLEGDSIIII